MAELTRRRFFGLLGGVVATAVAPPIFVLPPAGGWLVGMEEFQHPIEFDIGRTVSGFCADGGAYPRGVGPNYIMGTFFRHSSGIYMLRDNGERVKVSRDLGKGRFEIDWTEASGGKRWLS